MADHLICSNPRCYRRLDTRTKTIVNEYHVCSDAECIAWAFGELRVLHRTGTRLVEEDPAPYTPERKRRLPDDG